MSDEKKAEPLTDEEIQVARMRSEEGSPSEFAYYEVQDVRRLIATIDARDARIAEVERERDAMWERVKLADAAVGRPVRRAKLAAAEARAERLEAVVEAAREAICDTHNIPACVALAEALRAYDLARGAVCGACDGAGTIDGPEDDPGEGEPCGVCNGAGIIEPQAVCFTCQPSWSNVVASTALAIAPTCSRCGKPCDGGHVLMRSPAARVGDEKGGR